MFGNTFWVTKNFGLKKIWIAKKMLDCKKMLVGKIFCSKKKCWWEKIAVGEKFLSQKIWSEFFLG